MSKSRSRAGVKPILKKLHSHSEKNSLDLDRGWEDQTAEFGYGSSSADYYGGKDDDGAAGHFAAGNARMARDVSFSLSSTDLANSRPAGTPKFSHARSTSGTSHVSVATTGSGRNGSFVHPFQQTPRTSTPPLSYANSLVSLDNAPPAPREYSSPIITEDDAYDPDYPPANGAYTTKAPRSYQPTKPRRPSLNSQRTSSFTDASQPLRPFASSANTLNTFNTTTTNTTTTRSGSATPTPRFAAPHGSANHSHTDLHLHASSTAADSSPLSSPELLASPSASSATAGPTTTTSSAPMSMTPLRGSLDMNGFRLRSRSDIDTATRQEQVRQARRKFEEKEKAKEEKYAREQVRKRERADTKEAQRIERAHAQMRKASFGNGGLASGRTSSSTEVRPTASRKSTGTGTGEKLAFSSHGYDAAASGQVPQAKADDVHFEPTRKSKNAKRKTMGAWTAFVLWFRTRLLKLGRR